MLAAFAYILSRAMCSYYRQHYSPPFWGLTRRDEVDLQQDQSAGHIYVDTDNIIAAPPMQLHSARMHAGVPLRSSYARLAQKRHAAGRAS